MQKTILLLKWIANRYWYRKRPLYILKDWLLYTKPSRNFYKRVVDIPYEISHTRYFNFLGRTLFSIKEIIALVSHDKIFKKSISLEGYDDVDLKALYAEGAHDLMWPPSPYVELEKPKVDDAFVQKISDSYHLSYHNDPHANLDKEQLWEKHILEFRDYYLDEEGHLKKDRLIEFRKNKGSNTHILTDHFKVLNQDFGYFKSYLKSLDLVLDYHRFSNFVDPTILGLISESHAGKIQTPLYRGQRLSERVLFLSTVASQIKKHITFKDTKRKCVVDIGGGFGHMGRFTHYYVPNSCYILVELNEMSCFGAYFLQYAFPNKKVATFVDIADRMDDFESLIEEYDFIILPTWGVEKIPENFVDLYIATNSIAEMPQHFAQLYLDQVDRTLKHDGYFYTNTRVEVEKEEPYLYVFYKWRLKSKFLTLSYQYHPVNHILRSTPEWIGKKV